MPGVGELVQEKSFAENHNHQRAAKSVCSFNTNAVW